MDLSEYKEPKPHRIKRLVWYVVNATLFRCFPGNALRFVRNIILRAFGAKIPLKSLVYGSSNIYAPWNLEIGEHSCIGPNTQIYNKAKVIIKDNCVVSQGAFLCTASHDITDSKNPLITSTIIMDNMSWVAANAYVGMGVTIGEGAVVGATASVYKDVEPWTVVGGNPARFIKKRVIKDA